MGTMQVCMRRALAVFLLILGLLCGPTWAWAVEGFKVVHTVAPGENLGRIASKYKVKVRDVRRWNRLRSPRIRVGQKLTVYSTVPQRPYRMLPYRVQRGDSLNRIAKKFKVGVRELRGWNGLRRNVLRLGQTLKVRVPGPEKPSKSSGRPQYGRLKEGERLPKGPGYHMLNSERAYGANNVITHLMTCIPKVRRKWKRAPDLVIGDISRKNGGHLAPHRSHQNGLDVDIGYYHKVALPPGRFAVATPKTLDVEKTWFLLKCFLDTKEVDYVFVDYKLQQVLYNYARRLRGKKQRVTKKWLDTVFQYPRRGQKGVIRHARSHHHHFHIRFKAATIPGADS